MNTSLWYGGLSPHQPFHCPSPQSPPPTGPNMFRPMTAAPTFSSVSSMIRELAFTSPPSLPCASRQAASGTTQSCSRSPPSPSGSSSLWFGPATNPSTEIEMSHLSLLIPGLLSSQQRLCLRRGSAVHLIGTCPELGDSVVTS